jgi:arylsulfatase A-like enzyme
MIVRTALLVVLGILSSAAALAAPPNVVVILTDDQGWGDLSVHGNANLSTPRIDSLARDGALFERFYVSPVCSPTRAEMLTGRYHPRTGVQGVTRGEERMNTDESTLAEMLQAEGYATGAFGKWHNGSQGAYHPNARGVEEYYGFTSGHWGDYFSPMLEHNGDIVRGDGFVIDDFTTRAMGFMRENRAQPFFCYLAYNTPHTPFQVPERFWNEYKDKPITMRHRDGDEKEDIQKTRAALAMCANIDWNVGRVLDQLDALGVADNTVVIFFTDNGPNTFRWNQDMRGKKGTTDEGGVRVPCLVRWPAGIKGGTRVEKLAGAIDLLPTLAEVTGAERVGSKPIDGTSVLPLLQGRTKNWPARRLFAHWRSGRVSVREQRFMMDYEGKLYDLDSDPGQRVAVNDAFPDKAAELQEAVTRWRADVLPKPGEDTRPFPVGHNERPTFLPARDGVASGGIERSARAPNCSFFTNWTDTAGRITWNIEVENAGTYEAVVYYACLADDLGSTVALSFGDAQLTATVDEAHDPPLYGLEHDIAPRGTESFVKDFKPMRLGTVTLPEGAGPLTLRALEVPGDSVMEMRLLALTRVE